MTKLIWWSILLLVTTVFAQDASLLLRIRETQDSLIEEGANLGLLSEYDQLITDLEKAMEDNDEKITANLVAQVYYNKAIMELSLNKVQRAIGDLGRTLDLDPSFSLASSQLIKVLVERGRFGEIRARFSAEDYADTFLQMDKWENAYLRVSTYVSGETSEMSVDECLEIILMFLMPITPYNSNVFEAHLYCTKGKAKEAVADGDHETALALYKEIISDYSRLLNLHPQRNLQHYSDFAEYKLFTQLMAQDSWAIVKSCLRIDNVFEQCGSLSKMFSKLQDLLKHLEEYSILDGFLYPNVGEQTDLQQARLDSFDFDFRLIDETLSGRVNLAKREMSKLPKNVRSVYDFLMWKVDEFSQREFGVAARVSRLMFVEVLNKLACEAGVRSGKAKNPYCGEINDGNDMFFPKYAAQVDQLIKRKNFKEAQRILQKCNRNVQKTAFFKERWSVVERHRQQQQQKHQQQQQYEFHQRQQRLRQYQKQRQHQQHQQRQQQNQDKSKDYYKILDIPKDADEKTIKKGYRTQTLKYHPDKYKGGDLSEKQIEEKMQDINEAYEVLSDAESRQSYDRGDSGEGQGGGHPGGFGGQPNMNFHFDPNFMGNFMRDGHFQFHF